MRWITVRVYVYKAPHCRHYLENILSSNFPFNALKIRLSSVCGIRWATSHTTSQHSNSVQTLPGHLTTKINDSWTWLVVELVSSLCGVLSRYDMIKIKRSEAVSTWYQESTVRQWWWESQMASVLILVPPLISWVSLGKFSILQAGRLLWWLNKETHVKCLDQCLASSERSLSGSLHNEEENKRLTIPAALMVQHGAEYLTYIIHNNHSRSEEIGGQSGFRFGSTLLPHQVLL